MELERNPDQDFLGKMFMQLELGNHWKGQFFTSYNVCHLMAEMNMDAQVKNIEEKAGYPLVIAAAVPEQC